MQKFDHFVVGLLGAWLAFLIRDFHPTKFTLHPLATPSFLDAAAILVIIAALVFGLLKIERNIKVDWISYELIPEINQALAADKSQFKTIDEYKAHLFGIVKTQKEQKRQRKLSSMFGRWRNWAGLCGIFLLIAARISVPYVILPEKQASPAVVPTATAPH